MKSTRECCVCALGCATGAALTRRATARTPAARRPAPRMAAACAAAAAMDDDPLRALDANAGGGGCAEGAGVRGGGEYAPGCAPGDAEVLLGGGELDEGMLRLLTGKEVRPVPCAAREEDVCVLREEESRGWRAAPWRAAERDASEQCGQGEPKNAQTAISKERKA